MASKGQQGPSKQRTHLLDSKRMFYSMTILWHCHAMVGRVFPVLAPAKRALFIPHTLAKLNCQNPQPAKRSILVKPAKLHFFSVSSRDPIPCMLLQKLFPCLYRTITGTGIFQPKLGAIRKLNRWLKRNEHEPQSR